MPDADAMGEQLAGVRQAIAEARWADALMSLDDNPTLAAGTEGLELRAEAAYGAGDPEASVAAWESLYALTLAAGDRVAAARSAAMVAMYLMIDSGLMAPIRGWLRRAERLIDDCDETPVHALSLIHI